MIGIKQTYIAQCQCCDASIHSTDSTHTMEEFVAILPDSWYINTESGANPSVICRGCLWGLHFHITVILAWLLEFKDIKVYGFTKGKLK